MAKKETLTLAHPRVQKAKARFERFDSGRKKTLNFDQLFEHFKSDNFSFEKIAEMAEVRSDNLLVTYNRYFRDLFGGMTRGEYLRSLAHKKTAKRTRTVHRDLSLEEFAEKMIKKARTANCEIVRVRERDLPKAMRSVSILVNGYHCRIRHLTGTWKAKTSYRRLVKVSLYKSMLSKTDFIIFHTTVYGFPEHTFVVPSAVLRARFFVGATNNFKTIYLPTENLPAYNTSPSRIDWWKYEDAWHLLKPKKPRKKKRKQT